MLHLNYHMAGQLYGLLFHKMAVIVLLILCVSGRCTISSKDFDALQQLLQLIQIFFEYGQRLPYRFRTGHIHTAQLQQIDTVHRAAAA